MADREQIGSYVDSCVDALADDAWALARSLFEHPQVAFEETFASGACREALTRAGFELVGTWDDLPTAFVAERRLGEGPCLGVVSELDALPQIGHACGHHLIAASGVLTGIVAARAMERFGVGGTIRVFGTPAEEDGGGKILMLQKGAWDGTDAVLLMHPTSATTRIGGECCSASSCYVTFHGKSAQAESHPENGVNAMDAQTLFHVALGLTRQQLPDGLHICDVVTGMSDDITNIPDHASLETEITTMNAAHLERGELVLRRIAEGVAHATGCTVDFRVERGYLGRVPNSTISEVLRAELEAVGEPCMPGMPSDQGSEDLGDVSRVIPAVNLFGTILPDRKISGHTVEFRELAGGENGRHCLIVNSKAMARTLLDLMRDPSLLVRARDELAKRLDCA